MPALLLRLCTLSLILAGCSASAPSGSTDEPARRTSPNIIYAEEIARSQAYTLADLLVGRIAGVYTQGGELRIRGNSAIQGDNEPLYVLDDVPLSTPPDLIMTEIESVEVLKGNEAARFGIRGMNGAILIKTKVR